MGRRLTDVRYRVVSVADPAVATDLTTTPTGAHWWVIRSLVVRLVTDANVADRTVVLEQTDGTNVYWRAAAGAVQAAGVTVDYSAYPGAAAGAAVGGHQSIALDGYGQVVPPGHVIRTAVDNLQAGDQLSAVALHVLELETGRLAPAVPIADLWIEEYDPLYTR